MTPAHLTGWYGTPMSYSKAQGQRYHALKRARDRYGVDLGEDGYRALVLAILRRSPNAQCFGRETLSFTRWRVRHEGVWMDAIYDRKRHQIVTFLPAGTFEARGYSEVGPCPPAPRP